MSKDIPFESQSITIIERIMKDKNISRQEALNIWFNSRTYNEIIRRNVTFISAMRAYFELNLELTNNPEWMKNEFE